MNTVIEFGAAYRFGFAAANAPALTGIVMRSAELRWEPEWVNQANSKEGHAAAIVLSKPYKRKILGMFTGYCLATFNAGALPNHFFFLGRCFLVKSVSDPYKKGIFSEVSIEAESFANVTGQAG